MAVIVLMQTRRVSGWSKIMGREGVERHESDQIYQTEET